jgi:putative ABC transport system substrate-binding protein
MAAELVQLKVDLIVSFTGQRAIRDATASIPIVMASGFYPVETGIVASLARPGGNITGVAMFTPGLMAKRVQILKEAVPKVSRVAVLRLEGEGSDLIVRDFEAAARRLGVQLQVIAVGRPEDLSGAFETAVRGGARALMTTQAPFFAINRAQIAELALKHRLPSLSGEAGAAAAGTLLFFGPNIPVAGCQRAAAFVDRILKGAKPAELPVEQPTVVELVVNLKTAKALGLTIPQSILRRADRVIDQ